jgi:hypothetical protein
MTDDDQVPGGRRPSSGNFDKFDMSVIIAAECVGGIDALLSGCEGFGVASFTAGEVRQLGFGVVRDPDPAVPGHALVVGNKSHGKRNRLARLCRLLRTPGSITREPEGS